MERKISTISIHIVHDEPGPGEFLAYLTDYTERKLRNRGALEFAYEVETEDMVFEDPVPDEDPVEDIVIEPPEMPGDDESVDPMFDPGEFTVNAMKDELDKYMRRRGKNKVSADDLAILSKAEQAGKARKSALEYIESVWQALLGKG